MKLLPKDLNIGDVFYECDMGRNFKMVVETKPEVTEEDGYQKWNWTAKNVDGESTHFLMTEGLEHYGPKIYLEPQYFRFDENGDLDFEAFTS